MEQEIEDAEVSARLMSAIDDLQERIFRMKHFDTKEEINAYCDDLESHVLLTAESIVKRVAEMEKVLLAEIGSYRRRLHSREAASMETDEHGELSKELASLASEVEAFKAKCSAQQRVLISCHQEVDMLEKKAKKIRRQLRHQAFNGDFVKFCENNLVGGEEESNLIGELRCYDQDTVDGLEVRDMNLDTSKADVHQLKPSSQFQKKLVRSLAFLSDGSLAIGMPLRPITVCSIETDRVLYKLEPVDSSGKKLQLKDVRVLVQLANGNLASGDSYGNVDIWDLQTRKHIRRSNYLMCHHLIALPNGNLIVFECNINVNNPNIENGELHRFYGVYHGARAKVLSNGHLLAINAHGPYTMWNLDTGETIKRGCLSCSIRSLTRIMSSGDVYICGHDGTVRVHNLIDGKPPRVFHEGHSRAREIVELPDGSALFLYGRKWNLSVRRDDEDETPDRSPKAVYMPKFVVSPNGKILAAGCNDGTFVLWPLK